MTYRRGRALVGLAVLGASVGASFFGATAAGARPPAARRLLVVSLPQVTWSQLPLDRMPNLRALLTQSIVADLSVRGVDPKSTLGDAYTTIAAGTRAVGNSGDGHASERVDGSVIVPAFPDIVLHNNHLLFDAHVGALGTALARARINRAVIGNADLGPAATAPPNREVALALATPNGATPGGSVGPALLEPRSGDPFGVGLDIDAFRTAFARAWTGRTVVVAEDSDLVRFDAARKLDPARATPSVRDALLERFDGLLGTMLAAVDPARDAVMVIGPVDPSGVAQLTVASLRAPGIKPGLAVSAFTRRAGFVSIVDVGPTILDVFHVAAPESMEGRPLDRGRTGGTFAQRRNFLVDANLAAQFRDARIGPVTVAFIGGQVVLTLGAAIAFRKFGRRSRRVIELGALSLLGVLPATFIAGAIPFERHPAVYYWLFVVGLGVAIALAASLVRDESGVGPLIACLTVIVVLLVADITTGARLQFNTVFGYSPTVGGRYAGIGNLAYSQLSAAALLLACLVAYLVGGRRGAWCAAALLAAAIIVDGMPIWGSDIGGVLSMVPAYAIAVTGLLGWRIRVRAVLIGAAATIVLLVGFAALDVSRPKDRQTHLGRLVESVRSGGWHSFRIVLERKLSENFGVLFSSVWTLMVPIVIAGIGYIIYRAPGRLRALHDRIPPMRWALLSLAVLAVLGFSLNDSGISIPGVMLGVLTPVMLVILVRAGRAIGRAAMKGAVTVALVVVGLGSVRLLMLLAPDLLRAPALQRANYRAKELPTAGGLLVVLAVILIEGSRLGLAAIGVGHRAGFDGTRPLVVLACLGFGFLGLLDDVLATGGDRGFGGHVSALASGRVTTGLVKLVGGGALALVLASAPGPEGRLRLVADAALIALAANLGNLLDRRPGRALKCGLVAWIPLIVLAGGDGFGVAIAPVMGAFLAIGPDDLGERLMLGDCGANVLGAVLGFGVVLECGFTARLVVLGVLVALNLASEWVSFSSVIDRVEVLRRVDEAGRRDP